MKKTKIPFNEKVKFIRTFLGYSQEEFANFLNVSTSLISKIEVGAPSSDSFRLKLVLITGVGDHVLDDDYSGELNDSIFYHRPLDVVKNKSKHFFFDPATDTLYKELKEEISFLRETIRALTGKAVSANFLKAINGTGLHKSRSLKAAA